jgi:hypothetical protein
LKGLVVVWFRASVTVLSNPEVLQVWVVLLVRASWLTVRWP